MTHHDAISSALDVSLRRAQAEMQTETELALRIAERAIGAMKLSYVVDSGASRDALPLLIFNGKTPKRRTDLTSSNGVASKAIYNWADIPRLGPGKANQEVRGILGVNGAPVLSLGYQIESSKRPAALYMQEWQGFVWDDGAKSVAGAVTQAVRDDQVTSTPAENQVPRFIPNKEANRQHEIEQNLFLADPEFHAPAEALSVPLTQPEYREAFATALEAQAIVKAGEEIIKTGWSRETGPDVARMSSRVIVPNTRIGPMT